MELGSKTLTVHSFLYCSKVKLEEMLSKAFNPTKKKQYSWCVHLCPRTFSYSKSVVSPSEIPRDRLSDQKRQKQKKKILRGGFECVRARVRFNVRVCGCVRFQGSKKNHLRVISSVRRESKRKTLMGRLICKFYRLHIHPLTLSLSLSPSLCFHTRPTD